MIKVQCVHLQTVAKTMPETNVHRGDVELGGLQNHSYYHNVSISIVITENGFQLLMVVLCAGIWHVDGKINL